jgi:hypothetical protein
LTRWPLSCVDIIEQLQQVTTYYTDITLERRWADAITPY